MKTTKQFIVFAIATAFLLIAIVAASNFTWDFEKTLTKDEIYTGDNELCLNDGKCGASPYTCQGDEDNAFYFHEDLINHYSEQLFKINSDKDYDDCTLSVEIELDGDEQAKEDFLYKLNSEYIHFYDPGFKGIRWVTLPETFTLEQGENFLHFKSPEFCKTVWQRNDGQTSYGSVHLYNIKIQCGKTEIPVDTTAPEITIHSPENNVYYKTKSISLKVSANEPSTWKYSLNEGDKISFQPNITIQGKEGKNELIVYATDNAGNTASESVVFYVDTIMPILEIESPEEGRVYHDEDVAVKFTATDTNLYKFWFIYEDEKIYSNDTEIELEDGDYELVFYAIDKSGNQASKTVSFSVDLDEDDDEDDGSSAGKCRSCEQKLMEYEEDLEQEPEIIYKTRGTHIEPETLNEEEQDKGILSGVVGTVIIVFLILDILLLIILAIVLFSR